MDSTRWEAWHWLQQVQVQVWSWPKGDQKSLLLGFIAACNPSRVSSKVLHWCADCSAGPDDDDVPPAVTPAKKQHLDHGSCKAHPARP